MKRISLLIALTAMLAYCQDGYSSGFFLIEQSVSSMGNAYAGAAAEAEDASTIFFNPAGMTRLCGNEYVSGLQVVMPRARFHDEGSIHATTVPLTGGDGHDSGVAGFIPHNYFVKSYRDSGLAFGLGINSPFGLATEYGHTWKGRYHAIRSSILTIDINPSVAMRINKCWSIGVGFNAMYLHAKFTNAVDFGLIIDNITSFGTDLSQTVDGKAIVKGNSWGYGGNIGVLWEPTCRTRFGLHYRSEIKHRVEGSEKFKDTAAAFTAAGNVNPAIEAGLRNTFKDTRVKSDITLPSLLSFSGYHEFNDCWAVLGDVSWTKWNVIPRLRFRFNNDAQPDAITTLKWQNSIRYSLGVTYRPSCCWTFRTGLSYDETPIRNEELRTPRLPGEDRFWTAFGVGYQWSRCIHTDFAYAHLFLRKPVVDKAGLALAEDGVRGGLKGDYPNATTDIVSVQLVWDF